MDAEVVAGGPLRGVLHIREAGGSCVITDVWTIGTVADLPALGWKLARKLQLLEDVCEALSALHAAGLTHGCLAPANIVLTDDLRPRLTEVGAFDPTEVASNNVSGDADYGPYAAPEVLAGRGADVRSDIYSLGRILAFLLTGEPPSQREDGVARLDWLARAPAGLVRIVRRATAEIGFLRYGAVSELQADLARYGDLDSVGMAHPDAIELNKTGLSGPPTSKPRQDLQPAAAIAPVDEVNHAPARRWISGAVGAVAVAIGVTLVLADPVTHIGRWASRRDLDSPTASQRAQAVRRLVARGDRRLDGANLAHTDLSGIDLSSGSLVGASLVSANLQGANLSAVDADKLDLSEANLSGADVSDVELSRSLGVQEACCDEATLLPDGWSCLDGRVVHKEEDR
jgi:hypothetical protein